MGNQISKEQVVIPILGQHQHDGNDSITSLMENRQCRRRPRNLSRRVFLNAWIIIILLFHVGLVAPARAQERCPIALTDEYHDRLDRDVTLLSGTPFYSFTCSGTQHATFELDGVAVTARNVDSRKTLTDKKLALSDVGIEDSGCYRCRGMIAGKLCESESVCLSVLKGYPRIKVETTEFFVKRGSVRPLTLRANVSNIADCGPNLVVVWSMNHKRLRTWNGTNGYGAVYTRSKSWLILTLSNSSHQNSSVQLVVGNEIQFAKTVEFKIIVFATDSNSGPKGTDRSYLSPSPSFQETTQQSEKAYPPASTVDVSLRPSAFSDVVGVPPSNETGTHSYTVPIVLSASIGGTLLIIVIVVVIYWSRYRTAEGPPKTTAHGSNEDVSVTDGEVTGLKKPGIDQDLELLEDGLAVVVLGGGLQPDQFADRISVQETQL